MPEHSALLAVDVIGSGSSRPEHLGTIPDLVRDLTQAALHAVGIDGDRPEDDQFTGDGFLRAYPSRFLPALIDMISVLDALLAEHNRTTKPEIRLRVAVHLGPLPARRGFYRPNIDLSRLLEAAALKHVVDYCREHITGDTFTTALILSDNAYRTVFQGDYTRVIGRNEFAPLLITNNEFDDRSWVRVAGVHPTQISGIPPATAPSWDSTPLFSDSGMSIEGVDTAQSVNTSSHAGGRSNEVQAGTVHGNVSQSDQGKYVVTADHAQGVQIGDGNTQNVDFRRSPSE
ncbi:hypothetical protein LZ318_27130 [Saccharopolyspora indica]|uniref:hypothetical protein n=1 Tax=Saccharopolyspora indica TaxID=1229659 RepID=UPI0022EB2A6B|nr:hypothetical protein [Saccharopolyspora indica]MDA3645153.1 hypothetical protein [Saccharopolyspora indica]